MRKILGSMRKAIQKFNMIQANDRIAVGLSGGKDSTALLVALNQYQHFSPVPFSLEALTLDMGFGGMDFTPMTKLCHSLDIPYTICKTQIGPIVFDIRKEKNPCSLCARMKRGALHDEALKRGCKKLALGHHADDVVETFFLSLFYESRINTFLPVTYLDRKGITLIRPFVFVHEKEIIFSKACQQLPHIKNTCPADGHTKRAEIKTFIQSTRQMIPDIDERVLSAIQNKDQLKLWFDIQGVKHE